jgi:hypothetical protein
MDGIKINRDDVIHAIESEIEYINDIMADIAIQTIKTESLSFYKGKESAYQTVLSLLKEEGGNNMDG